MINKTLAQDRGLTQESIAKVEAIHKMLDLINENIDTYTVVFGYKGVADSVTNLDYMLQELWGFDKNSDYHRHWSDIEGCCCGRLDNRDRLGTPYKITSGDCPFHGENV